MPSEENHEGIVLKSIPFRDQQKIITLYTAQKGLVSLIVKGMTRKKTNLLTLTSPFTHGEYLYRIMRSDLYTFLDGTVIKTHYSLRQNLSHLNAATLMAKALLSSQMPGKPSINLFQLMSVYLKYLTDHEDPSPLSASFLLKILKHDGHLNASQIAAPFTTSEWEILCHLLQTRSMAVLRGTEVSTDLLQKVEKFFKKVFSE